MWLALIAAALLPSILAVDVRATRRSVLSRLTEASNPPYEDFVESCHAQPEMEVSDIVSHYWSKEQVANAKQRSETLRITVGDYLAYEFNNKGAGWKKGRGFSATSYTGWYIWGGYGDLTLQLDPKAMKLTATFKSPKGKMTECESKGSKFTCSDITYWAGEYKFEGRKHPMEGARVSDRSLSVRKQCISAHFRWKRDNEETDVLVYASTKDFSAPEDNNDAIAPFGDDIINALKGKTMTYQELLKRYFTPAQISNAKAFGVKTMADLGDYETLVYNRRLEDSGSWSKWSKTRGYSYSDGTGYYLSGGNGKVQLELDPKTGQLEVLFQGKGHYYSGLFTSCTIAKSGKPTCQPSLRTGTRMPTGMYGGGWSNAVPEGSDIKDSTLIIHGDWFLGHYSWEQPKTKYNPVKQVDVVIKAVTKDFKAPTFETYDNLLDIPAWGEAIDSKDSKEVERNKAFVKALPTCLASGADFDVKQSRLFFTDDQLKEVKAGKKASVTLGTFRDHLLMRRCDRFKGTCTPWRRSKKMNYADYTGWYQSGGYGILRLDLSGQQARLVFRGQGMYSPGVDHVVCTMEGDGKPAVCSKELLIHSYQSETRDLPRRSKTSNFIGKNATVKVTPHISRKCIAIVYEAHWPSGKHEETFIRDVVYGDTSSFELPPRDSCLSTCPVPTMEDAVEQAPEYELPAKFNKPAVQAGIQQLQQQAKREPFESVEQAITSVKSKLAPQQVIQVSYKCNFGC